MAPPTARRSPLHWLLGLVTGLVALPLPTSANAQSDWASDPVHVYYDGAICPTRTIQLEVFDREDARWLPHPAHARVQTPSCQIEDAGVLLNELRWRCGPASGAEPGAWRRLDVFDPEVMTRCAVAQIDPAARRTSISVASPGEGVPVRAPEAMVTVVGSVRVDGVDGTDYEVTLLIDRSTPPAALEAQVSAARAFVTRMKPRLGPVRIAVLSYPNSPPGPGETQAARLELSFSEDADALDASLARLAGRPAAGPAALPEALDFALAQLAHARPDARPVFVLALDGSRLDDTAEPRPDHPWLHAAARVGVRGAELHWVALGGVAADDTPLARRALERAPGSFRRVSPEAFGSAFLAPLALPVAEAVWVEGAPGDARIDAALDSRGRFRAQVPVAPGANPLVIRARTSDGAVAERPFELVFDDSLVLEGILEAERERMRAAQRKQLDLRAEEPDGR